MQTPSTMAPDATMASPPDPAEVMAFMDRVMRDMSGAMTSVLCAVGVRLGLLSAMAQAGPVTSAELAARTGLSERYVKEWMHGLASAGYLEWDRQTGRATIPGALAVIIASDGSPFDLAPGYQLIPALAQMVPVVAEAFRSGDGVSQDRYPADLYEAMERMSAGWLETELVRQWIPAVDGLAARLHEGARVADIGSGRGRAMIACAQAFPESRFTGFDAFGPNVEYARGAADEAEVADRVRFVQADATTGLTGYYDLVTAFSVVHDAPDPVALFRSVHRAVAPDGVFLLLESSAADDPIDNVGPAASVLYATSVLYCLPSSLADGGPGLGTLGLPPERIRDYCGQAGFRSVRRLPCVNPFNAVYEIRP